MLLRDCSSLLVWCTSSLLYGRNPVGKFQPTLKVQGFPLQSQFAVTARILLVSHLSFTSGGRRAPLSPAALQSTGPATPRRPDVCQRVTKVVHIQEISKDLREAQNQCHSCDQVTIIRMLGCSLQKCTRLFSWIMSFFFEPRWASRPLTFTCSPWNFSMRCRSCLTVSGWSCAVAPSTPPTAPLTSTSIFRVGRGTCAPRLSSLGSFALVSALLGLKVAFNLTRAVQ